jgi:hypothetical protein
MLARPKKRIWPSCMESRRSKVRRQPLGERKGNKPSNTSIRARAAQSRSSSKAYFRVAAAGAGATLPRKDLKNSEAEGSSTTTSLFLLKLDLYASRLR